MTTLGKLGAWSAVSFILSACTAMVAPESETTRGSQLAQANAQASAVASGSQVGSGTALPGSPTSTQANANNSTAQDEGTSLCQGSKEVRDAWKTYGEKEIPEAKAVIKEACGCEPALAIDCSAFTTEDQIYQVRQVYSLLADKAQEYCSDAASKTTWCGKIKNLNVKYAATDKLECSSGNVVVYANGNSASPFNTQLEAKCLTPSSNTGTGSNSATGTGSGTGSATSTGTGSSTGNETGDETGNETGSATGTGTGNTSSGDPLGKITAATGDLGFVPKSAYAMVSTAGTVRTFLVMLSEDELTTTMFKKVKEWGECKPCTADTCEESTPAKTMSIILMDTQAWNGTTMKMEDIDNVDANGFPNAAEYDIPKPTTMRGVMVSYTDNAGDGKTWKVGNDAAKVIKFDTKPADVGDDFKISFNGKFLNVAMTAQPTDFTGAKTFGGTIEGKVYELPDNPAAPQCEEDEYLDPTYED